MGNDAEYLNANQVHEVLGLSRPIVAKLLREGEIEGAQIGSHRNAPWIAYAESVEKKRLELIEDLDRQESDLQQSAAGLAREKDRKPPYVTVEETAEILGKSRPTIFKWLDRGTLKGDKVGDYEKSPWLISPESVDAVRTELIEEIRQRRNAISRTVNEYLEAQENHSKS